MKTFNLIPTVSCGEMAFLTPRDEVRMVFGEFTEFKKSKTSENSTDDFGFCHAYYNQSDELVALELFPEAVLKLDGCSLFELSPEGLFKLLSGKTKSVQRDDYSICSVALGVCAEVADGAIESILVCTEDYLD
jgi:hypothetical protein